MTIQDHSHIRLLNLRFLSAVHSLSILQNAADEELARLVRTAHQRSAGRVQETQLIAAFLPLGKLGRRHVLDHLQMAIRRLHILAEGQTVDAHGAQILHRLLDLLVRFAQAQHDGRFGDEARVHALHVGQHLQRLSVASATVAHERRQQLDRFDVVGEHVQAGIGDGRNVLDIAAEIG